MNHVQPPFVIFVTSKSISPTPSATVIMNVFYPKGQKTTDCSCRNIGHGKKTGNMATWEVYQMIYSEEFTRIRNCGQDLGTSCTACMDVCWEDQ